MANRSEYNTKALAAVLECLEKADGKHLTAEEIKSRLLNEGTALGTATVYRNLDKLLSRGKITRYQGDGCACYCVENENCHAQIHLVCEECGKLLHLECKSAESMAQHLEEEHGFTLSKHRTVFYGLCEECRV